MKAIVFNTLIALLAALAVVSWFIGLAQGAQSNSFYITAFSLLTLGFVAVVELFREL
jgi:hypothetical protein